MEYTKIIKHAKNITKSKHLKARPILKNMYLNDNTITVTDSHRFFKINHAHIYNNTCIDPKTENIVDNGSYPDCTRLVPDNEKREIKTSFNINQLENFIAILKALKVMKIELLDIKKVENKMSFNIHSGNYSNKELKCFNIEFNIDIVEDITNDFKISVNAAYLLDCFEFLKDSKQAQFEMNFFGKMYPMTIKDHNDTFTYLLLPVRTY